jgi:hypothetical protein
MEYALQLSFTDKEVKDQVQLVLGFGKRTIEESFKLGEMLVSKKAEKGHGNWLPYLEDIGINERFAQRLMTAFKDKDNYIEGMTYSELVKDIKNDEKSDLPPEPVDPFKDWSEEEKRLRVEWNEGKNTIVINMEKHPHLVRYAADLQVYKRIDRGTDWGNPFLLDADGTRDQVCDWYQEHYLAYKKSLLNRIGTLKGKILGCHCYPKRCHGDTLKTLANETD